MYSLWIFLDVLMGNIIYKLKNWIKNLPRSVIFFIQRRKQGWDDSDIWSLDCTLAKLILPRLKRLREIHCGYPYNLTEEKWNTILDKMIIAFSWYQSEERWCKKELQEIKEGMSLFAEYYSNLWD